MTALSADKRRVVENAQLSKLTYYPAAANAVWYAGSLINVDTSGNALAAADTSGYKCVGVARTGGNNTGGSAGDVSIQVEFGQVEKLVAGTGITAADIGTNCTVADDATVTDAATATNDVLVGRIVRVDSDGAWVEICTFAEAGA